MKIGILDDVEGVREAFSQTISRSGHAPFTFRSASEVNSLLNRNPKALDILYVDHFLEPSRASGLSNIRGFRELAPDIEYILTTSREIDAAFIEEVVRAGVAFFSKHTEDWDLLLYDIRHREIVIANNRLRQRRMIEKINEALTRGSEAPILGILGRSSRTAVILGEVARLNGTVVIPSFRRIATAFRGSPTSVKIVQGIAEKNEFMASTDLGAGLSIRQSSDFFVTKVGAQIKSTISQAGGMKSTTERRQTTEVVREFRIPEGEEMRGIRKMEFFEGLEYARFRVSVHGKCDTCCDEYCSFINVYAFPQIVETCASYNAADELLEDGRRQYNILEDQAF